MLPPLNPGLIHVPILDLTKLSLSEFAGVILSAGVGAALYKRATKKLEKRASEARVGMAAIAGQAFHSIRTVRSFNGEALERERFYIHSKEALETGIGFAQAKVQPSLWDGREGLRTFALVKCDPFKCGLHSRPWRQ